MNVVGQLCLLGAFIASGYACFGCIAGSHRDYRSLARTGSLAAVAGVTALTVAGGVLVWALLAKDFQFAYVSEYSSRSLPWHYSLSALWVGQAGSLLLWAWFLGVIALGYRFWPGREPSPLREPAFGILMGYVCFLVATMVFGADPMEPSLATPSDGAGLTPLLQHPTMLTHPPVVFLGYAAWAVPFALAVTALATGRLDAAWARQSRRWALFAWAVLGAGILLGGQWAYEELGWGGYWSWDPVENGSLMPWLTGTALIHCLMSWQYRGALKKTAVSLAIATFLLCNFATFLTRSGIFSSLHAFSRSPIGWMFFALMVALGTGGSILIVVRRARLRPGQAIPSVWAREGLVLVSVIALLLLAAATLVGTLAVPLSNLILGRKIALGLAFYNNVLIPTGLLLLATVAVAPLSRWGASFLPAQRKAMLASAGAGVCAAILAVVFGVRSPIAIAVACLAALAVAALAAAVIIEARRRNQSSRLAPRDEASSRGARWLQRRQYAGFFIHLGFVCLALGVTGSCLGTRRHEVVMSEGETIEWAGHSIRLVRLVQRELPDKLVAESELEISRRGVVEATLLPAQHLHVLQNQWTTEVAIHSTWSDDFYAILHGGAGEGKVSLSFVVNPMMRWLWMGGWIIAIGTAAVLWPAGQSRWRRSAVPPPKYRSVLQSNATSHASR